MKGTDMPSTVYLNNKFIPVSDARIPVFDTGFLYGAGLFETILAVKGQLFYFHRHYARLRNSCAELGIPFHFSQAALRNIIIELLRRDMMNDVEARVKIIVTPGDTGMHISHRESTVLVSAAPFIRPSPRIPWKLLFEGGVQASALAEHKSLSYFPHRLALHGARTKGYDDAIFLDRHGNVSETSIASLLLFRDGEMLLPDSPDALPGITRRVLAEIAAARGIKVEERPVTGEELLDGYAVCVCNALLGPFPVAKINDTPLPQLDMTVFEALRDEWAKRGGSEGTAHQL